MSESNRTRGVWCSTPDAHRRIMYPIYTPKVGKDVVVVILSQEMTGAHVHYFSGRTQPCIRESGKCEGCERGADRRWKGYLACLDKAKGRQVLVEVTREAFMRCQGFAAYAGQLRGMVLRLIRSGEAKNSRVQAQLMKYTGHIAELPPEFNVKAALEVIWFTDPGQNRGLDRDGPTAADDAQATFKPTELFQGEGPYGR